VTSSPPVTEAITVGILGGGQLGRMLALAGVPLGMRCLVLEPAPAAPAGAVAEVLGAPYDDQRALDELARRSDVVTIEVEHVPVESLAWLAARLPVRPSPEVVAVGQDRLAEKRRLTRLGIPTAPWADAVELGEGFASGTILKRRTGGFDGRGQRRLEPSAAAAVVAAAREELAAPAVAEGVVAFERELSVVAARSPAGDVTVYPVVENRHADGILRETIAPAPGLSARLQDAAARLATDLMDDLGHVGVLALELFEVDGTLLANEFAPRVHNSGHWTIEGAATSQFAQHLRAICGLPLGDTGLRGPAAMVNLIGTEPERREVLGVPGAYLHRYGKEPRPQRKIGHVTVIGEDEVERDRRLDAVRALVGRAELRPASSP
jgi:5-(carboxyamino)imidazole ribonucleotide synthase